MADGAGKLQQRLTWQVILLVTKPCALIQSQPRALRGPLAAPLPQQQLTVMLSGCRIPDLLAQKSSGVTRIVWEATSTPDWEGQRGGSWRKTSEVGLTPGRGQRGKGRVAGAADSRGVLGALSSTRAQAICKRNPRLGSWGTAPTSPCSVTGLDKCELSELAGSRGMKR